VSDTVRATVHSGAVWAVSDTETATLHSGGLEFAIGGDIEEGVSLGRARFASLRFQAHADFMRLTFCYARGCFPTDDDTPPAEAARAGALTVTSGNFTVAALDHLRAVEGGGGTPSTLHPAP